jgi:hypothetical protein
MGLDHGLYCLGCCWALMLVMFAAGVADLAWMAALAGLMTYEKIGPSGQRVARVASAAAIGLAVLAALHPQLLRGKCGDNEVVVSKAIRVPHTYLYLRTRDGVQQRVTSTILIGFNGPGGYP